MLAAVAAVWKLALLAPEALEAVEMAARTLRASLQLLTRAVVVEVAVAPRHRLAGQVALGSSL